MSSYNTNNSREPSVLEPNYAVNAPLVHANVVWLMEAQCLRDCAAVKSVKELTLAHLLEIDDAMYLTDSCLPCSMKYFVLL